MTRKNFRVTPEMVRSLMKVSRSDFDWLAKHGLIKIGRDGLLNGGEVARALDRLDRMVSRFPAHEAPGSELVAEAEQKAKEILSAAREAEVRAAQNADRVVNLTEKSLDFLERHPPDCDALILGSIPVRRSGAIHRTSSLPP